MQIENEISTGSRKNSLNYSSLRSSKLELLDIDQLTEYVDAKHAKQINRIISSDTFKNRFMHKIFTTKYIKGVLMKAGLKDPNIRSLNEYLILKALENAMNCTG